jgi:hypothetical protein
MAFNANDYEQPPYQNGVMTLTHDEVVEVQDACKKIYEEFVPSSEFPVCDEHILVSRYNISTNFEKAVNGDTYTPISVYNPEYNTQGISPDYPEYGFIVPEPVVEEPEAPVEEETAPVDETTTEEETPVVDETEAPAEEEAAPIEEV